MVDTVLCILIPIVAVVAVAFMIGASKPRGFDAYQDDGTPVDLLDFLETTEFSNMPSVRDSDASPFFSADNIHPLSRTLDALAGHEPTDSRRDAR